MKIMSIDLWFYTKKYNIYIIFFLIFCLRLYGIDYGFPFFLVSDEEEVVVSALKMLQLKSIIPILNPVQMDMLIYPPFLPIITLFGILPCVLFLYIKSGFPEMIQFRDICLDNIEVLYLGARIVNICFNLLILYLIYKICRLLFNSKRIATLSVIFLATDFTFNFTGHFVRHWNLSTLLIWITIFFSFKMFYSNRFRNYLYPSISGGVGFGVSYVFGGAGFLFFTILHFIKYKIHNIKKIVFSLTIFVLFAFTSILIHPYPLLRLIENKENNVTALYVNKNFLDTIFFYLENLFFINPILLLLTFLSIIYCCCKKIYITQIFIFSSIIIMFIILLHLTVHSEVRYLMPIIPSLVIISSIGLNEILKKKKYLFQISIITFLLIYPFISSIYSSFLLSQNDTRIQALNWIKTNAPSNAKIANGMKNINLTGAQDRYKTDDSYSEGNLIGIKKNKLKEKFLFTNISKKFVDTNHNLNLLESLITNQYDYVLISYKYKHNKHYRLSKKFYKGLNNKFILVQKIESSFSDVSVPDLQSTERFKFPIYKIFSFKSFGPTVEIYKLKS